MCGSSLRTGLYLWQEICVVLVEGTDIKIEDRSTVPVVRAEVSVKVVDGAAIARIAMQQEVSIVVVVNEVGVPGSNQRLNGFDPSMWLLGSKIWIVFKEHSGLGRSN